MIETPPTSEQQLAQNVWLRQNDADGQYVEIVMPPFELNDLLNECVRDFPQYAIQVLEILAKREPDRFISPTRLTLDQIQGLRNTQILGTVLARQEIRGQTAIPLLPELQQAFGLAMQGRLRLTADPVPDL